MRRHSGAQSLPSAAYPRVTIVTPSFNQAEFLEETMCSVLDQGYSNLEYIIVDGGSTDNSVDIIRRYEKHLAWWVSEPDRGQCHAINKGWQRATGDIVAYLNSDDLYLPGALFRSVSHFMAHPDDEIIYGFAHHVDVEGRVFRRVKPPRFTLRRLVQHCFIPQPTVFLRRRLLDRVGLLNESLHYSLDYEFWLRAAKVTTPARVPAFTAAARYYADSKSGAQSLSFWREELELFDHLFAANDYPYSDPDLPRLAYLRRALFVSGNGSGFSQSEREQSLARLRTLQAPPSASELVSVITGLDAHSVSEYVTSTPGANEVDGEACDVHEILPAIVAGGIVDEKVARRAGGRLRVRSSTRAGLRRGVPRVKLIWLELFSTLRDPGFISTRGWWADFLLLAAGPGLLSQLHALADTGRTGRPWIRRAKLRLKESRAQFKRSTR